MSEDRGEIPVIDNSADNMTKLRKIQNKHLTRMMELCSKAHPYYRRLLRDRGLSANDFQRVEDLRKLPLIGKKEFSQDPESFRLEQSILPDLSTEERTLSEVIYTTGSSASPTPFYDTVHDRLARIQHLSHGAQIAGIRQSDTVMNLFPLSSVPHQGPINVSLAAMAIGAKLLWGMTGRIYEDFPVHRRMTESIDMIEDNRVTVLWGITTYVRTVLQQAQILGKDFSSVRLAMVMGESCSQSSRYDILERLKSLGSINPEVNNGYGFTEMQGPAMECGNSEWRHQPTPAQYYFEVIDPDTEEAMPDGEKGMLVVSHLNRRGTVLLRYLVGDVVALNHETCPNCGRWEPRFVGSPYRADGVTKIKGVLVNPAILQDQMSLLFQRGLFEYQFIVGKQDPDDRFSADSLTLKLSCSAQDEDRLVREASTIVVQTIEMTPSVEFLHQGSFSEISNDYKFSRFVDTRLTT